MKTCNGNEIIERYDYVNQEWRGVEIDRNGHFVSEVKLGWGGWTQVEQTKEKKSIFDKLIDCI